MDKSQDDYLRKCIICNGKGKIICDCGIENKRNKKCLTCCGEGSFTCPICEGEGEL